MPAGGGAPFLRLMHRVVDEYVGRREFVYDSWVPGISPKFLEPSGYDILVILHRIASVHLSVSREAQPAATRMLVVTLRKYAGHPISELAGASREGGFFAEHRLLFGNRVARRSKAPTVLKHTGAHYA